MRGAAIVPPARHQSKIGIYSEARAEAKRMRDVGRVQRIYEIGLDDSNASSLSTESPDIHRARHALMDHAGYDQAPISCALRTASLHGMKPPISSSRSISGKSAV